MGILWNVVSDTVLALPKYNLHGSCRGRLLGPELIEMTDAEILEMKIMKLTFLRLAAQTYSRLGNLLGPLITCIKALASHSCELANINELEEDLSGRDKDFVDWARVFIVNLKKIKDVKPFRRCC